MVNLISFSEVVKRWYKIFLLTRTTAVKVQAHCSFLYYNSVIYGNSLNCLSFHFISFHFRSRWQFCYHLQRTRDLTDNRQDFSELTCWKTGAVSCLCHKPDWRGAMELYLRNQNTRVKGFPKTEVCKHCLVMLMSQHTDLVSFFHGFLAQSSYVGINLL